MTFNSAENPSLPKEKNLELLNQNIANFIARVEYETQQQPEQASLMHFQKKLKQYTNTVDQQLNELRNETTHLQTVMSRLGVQEWHQKTEELVSESRSISQQFQDLFQELRQEIGEYCLVLNRSSMNSIKTAAQTISGIKHSTIQKISAEKMAELTTNCDLQLNKVSALTRGFQWKNFAVIAFLGVMVSIVSSLYIDNQWPWAMHAQIMEERAVGKMLTSAWDNLNPNDQDLIVQSA